MKMIGELFREGGFVVTDLGEEGRVHCSASLLPLMDSKVLAAHFPGKPIVPGACIVAAVSELVCRTLAKKLQISLVKNIKFMSLIEPKEGEPIVFEIDIERETKKVKAVVSYCDAVSCKMSLAMGEEILADD